MGIHCNAVAWSIKACGAEYFSLRMVLSLAHPHPRIAVRRFQSNLHPHLYPCPSPRIDRDKNSILFGYQADVSQKGTTGSLFKGKKRKGSCLSVQSAKKRGRGSTWKKGTYLPSLTDQTKGPDCSEKIELAKLGLGMKVLSFNCDGDALHIHNVLMTTLKQLQGCGGYTLIILAPNSTDLIEIESPRGGMSVSYLKDIVKSAKLFVRPLQSDVPDDETAHVEVCCCLYTISAVNLLAVIYLDPCRTTGYSVQLNSV